jgi:cell division protein FtsI (penicillin-binding protein 3)
MNIKQSILIRVRLAFLGVAVLVAGVVYRIVTVQVVEGDKWRDMGQSMGLKVMPIQATRGNIYAADGSLLATSLPFYQVALDPSISDDAVFRTYIDSLAYLLARFYGDRSPHQYKDRIMRARADRKRYMMLNPRQIGYQEKKQM